MDPRRTIYEADQDFQRFGKTLIANFKDTATLWAFLRASLRQCHIHKLSKVGKDKAAWAKADEYHTNLMDSDTMLTLENTNDARLPPSAKLHNVHNIKTPPQSHIFEHVEHSLRVRSQAHMSPGFIVEPT